LGFSLSKRLQPRYVARAAGKPPTATTAGWPEAVSSKHMHNLSYEALRLGGSRTRISSISDFLAAKWCFRHELPFDRSILGPAGGPALGESNRPRCCKRASRAQPERAIQTKDLERVVVIPTVQRTRIAASRPAAPPRADRSGRSANRGVSSCARLSAGGKSPPIMVGVIRMPNQSAAPSGNLISCIPPGRPHHPRIRGRIEGQTHARKTASATTSVWRRVYASRAASGGPKFYS